MPLKCVALAIDVGVRVSPANIVKRVESDEVEWFESDSKTRKMRVESEMKIDRERDRGKQKR